MADLLAPKCRHPDCGVRHWPSEGHSARYCAIWGGSAGSGVVDVGVTVKLTGEALARFGLTGGVEVELEPASISVPPELTPIISVPSADLAADNSVPRVKSGRGRPKIIGEPWVVLGLTRRTYYRRLKDGLISRVDDELPI